jgi:hypothetical protein
VTVAKLQEHQAVLLFGYNRLGDNSEERGTPPAIVHSKPAPTQAMHFNTGAAANAIVCILLFN